MAKVLIVDDEVGIREWLSEILEDEGYQVAVAANGDEGRRLWAEFAPDAVLLDIWMPDVDGITLLKGWKSQMGEAMPPVIMISGHATIETAVEATHHGAFGFLEKPISMQKLLEVLKKAIENHRAREKEAVPLLCKRLPTPLRPVIDAANAQLLQERTVLLLFAEPFFEQWLLRHLGERSRAAWLTADANLTVESLKLWHGHLIFAGLGEKPNRMMAKNLLFLAQHAAAYQIDLLAVAHGEGALQSWLPLVGEKLASAWRQSVKVPKLTECGVDLGTIVQEALEAELGSPISWSDGVKRTVERIALDGETTLEEWVQALLPLATHDALSPQQIEAALARERSDHLGPLFALPLKEAREAFERLYLERLLARTDLPVQRLAELAGLERTHFYRKLRQLGLVLRRKEEEEQ